MNAGKSPAGIRFAAKHSDIIFTSVTDLETAKLQVDGIKRVAREDYGREIRVFGRAHIIMRDTEKEALDYRRFVHARYEKAGDAPGKAGAAGNLPARSEEERKTLEDRNANFGSEIVGGPDQVAERLLSLHHAGVEGFAVSWVNYDEGLDQAEKLLVPRLVQAGVRRD